MTSLLLRCRALVPIACLLACVPLLQNRPHAIQQSPGADTGLLRVERVVDGDTLVVDGIGRVRLIGVDTPESVHPTRAVEHFAKEAAEFLRRLVGRQTVRLEYDQLRTDRYGRTLAYVFLSDDTFVNEQIIREGYGFAYTRYPFRYLDRFRQREREARAARVGLWADQ